MAVVALERAEDHLPEEGDLGRQHPRRAVAAAGHAHRSLDLVHSRKLVPRPVSLRGLSDSGNPVRRARRRRGGFGGSIRLDRACHFVPVGRGNEASERVLVIVQLSSILAVRL